MQILRDKDYKARGGYVVNIIGFTSKYPVGYLRGGDGEPIRWLPSGNYLNDEEWETHSLDLVAMLPDNPNYPYKTLEKPPTN